jgi:hypothetical protein
MQSELLNTSKNSGINLAVTPPTTPPPLLKCGVEGREFFFENEVNK